MKLVRIAGAVLTASLAIGLIACAPPETSEPNGSSSAPVDGGNLVIGADAEPVGLNPVMVTAFSSYDFTSLIYSGLLRWNAQMQIEPDLAEEYENPSPTQYIFHLREGVKWHNGKPFTASDVVYTFQTILDPAQASPHQNDFGSIDSVTAVDDLTVQFDLKAPDAAFLSYLATNPRGAIIPEGVENLDTAPIGTGPFVFKEYRTGQNLVLEKNLDYFEQDLPHLDTVTFNFLKDQASIISAMRSKAVDMSWVKDPQVAKAAVESDASIVSEQGIASRTFPVWINSTEGPLADERVRQALSLATDREAALNTVLKGSGEIAALIPSTVLGGYSGDGSDLPFYETSSEKAKKLLAEAGYPDGVDLGEYKVVAANDLDMQTAQILEQQWKAAGITVSLNTMETAPLLEDWTNGNFGLLSVSLVWEPDPDSIASRFSSTSAAGASMGMHDAELDQMITAARAELDPGARADAYLEIQKHIADQAYVLNVYGYPLRWEMYQGYVQEYNVLASNVRSYVRTTWLDK